MGERAMFGTGPILEGAFRLVRERPGAVAIWGLVYFLCVAGMMLAIHKAGLSFQLGMEVRNRVMDAYHEVMRMQV